MRKTMRRFLIAMILCTLTISTAPAFADTSSADNAKAGQVQVSEDNGLVEGEGPEIDGTEDGIVNDGTESVGSEGADYEGAENESDIADVEEDPLQAAEDWTPEMGLSDVTAPAVTVVDGTHLLVTWTGAEEFDGYQISYAKNVLFLRAKKVLKDAAEVSFDLDDSIKTYSCGLTLDGLNTKKRFYVRVRGYKNYGEDTYFSGWATTNTSGNSAAAIKFVKSGGSKLDIRKQAWNDLKYYSISQGSCSDGTFLYMCFEQRNGDDNGSGRARIKVAKVRISDWKVVNVSPSGQKLGHANDITYNPDQGYLVVTGAKTNDPYVRLVSPDSLTKIGKKKIKLSDYFSYVKAFNAIDYDSESQTYYIRSRFYGSKCFTLDQNFRMISDATMPTVFPSRSVQSCTALGEYFILSQSWYQSSSKNTVTIFDKAGNMIQHIKLKMKGELESLFFIGDQLYATMHKHVTGSYMTGFIFRILL